MKNEKVKQFLLSLLIVLSIFFLDRTSKLVVLNILEDKGSVDIYVNQFLNFFLVWNKGIGFGLFTSDQTIFYNIITFLIILINLVILYFALVEKGFKRYLFLMILGGSLGNLLDRLYYRAVPDFIDLNYQGFHWFIFNVADIFITIGILCLIMFEVLNYKK